MPNNSPESLNHGLAGVFRRPSLRHSKRPARRSSAGPSRPCLAAPCSAVARRLTTPPHPPQLEANLPRRPLPLLRAATATSVSAAVLASTIAATRATASLHVEPCRCGAASESPLPFFPKSPAPFCRVWPPPRATATGSILPLTHLSCPIERSAPSRQRACAEPPCRCSYDLLQVAIAPLLLYPPVRS